jgi:hypothetical protein
VSCLLALTDGVEKGGASISWCKWYLSNIELLNKELPDTTYELELDTPDDISSMHKLRVARSDWTKDSISPIIEILNISQDTKKSLFREWLRLAKTVDMISLMFVCLSGVLYAIARLTLLAVAFAAFRKQDERLYTDTWARFLPSIG